MKFMTKSFLLLFPDLLFSSTLIEGPYYKASNWSYVFQIGNNAIITTLRLMEPIQFDLRVHVFSEHQWNSVDHVKYGHGNSVKIVQRGTE